MATTASSTQKQRSNYIPSRTPQSSEPSASRKAQGREKAETKRAAKNVESGNPSTVQARGNSAQPSAYTSRKASSKERTKAEPQGSRAYGFMAVGPGLAMTPKMELPAAAPVFDALNGGAKGIEHAVGGLGSSAGDSLNQIENAVGQVTHFFSNPIPTETGNTSVSKNLPNAAPDKARNDPAPSPFMQHWLSGKSLSASDDKKTENIVEGGGSNENRPNNEEPVSSTSSKNNDTVTVNVKGAHPGDSVFTNGEQTFKSVEDVESALLGEKRQSVIDSPYEHILLSSKSTGKSDVHQGHIVGKDLSILDVARHFHKDNPNSISPKLAEQIGRVALELNKPGKMLRQPSAMTKGDWALHWGAAGALIATGLAPELVDKTMILALSTAGFVLANGVSILLGRKPLYKL